ncbi:proline iminopeptidase [Cadophora sp. MPI-SDFR-AT-0126]|nr:proline iminopeptidase [Leotiomycetes sp. MPI-SDFR-AT-0126]KAH7403174.1 proline iminopeptidase [Leotiomycetes sp. MPI-SDFR-AT-0126]
MAAPISPDSIKEGTIPFTPPGTDKSCQTWYKIFGSLQTTSRLPLIVLHGGPGLSHDYLLPMQELWTLHRIPVIFYDQIGNGKSTHLPETKGNETFWKEEIFWDELDNLIQGLGLKEYDVLGQSWGGMLGSKWAGIRNPKGLRRLILSNSPADLNEWERAYAGYRKLLPEDVEAKLRKGEDAEDWEGKEYEEALMFFFSKHMITVKPMPAELLESLAWAGRDGTVAMTMSGPDEFKSRGVLKNWSAAEAAKGIEVPTLVINGVNEGASDEAVKPFVEGIKNVKWVKLENSTHCPLHEEKENYLQVVSDFLLSE